MVTAESLFDGYFWPLYPADVRKGLAAARAADANPANNPRILAHLDDAARGFVSNAAALFGQDLGLDYSDASVHRVSAALTSERRDIWAALGPAGEAESPLFNAVIHGAAYVGACVVKNHGGRWSVRRPLWESLVHLESHAGVADLAIFPWWLKALADDAPETLADRYRALVEVPCTRPGALPPLAPAGRRLPRIAKNVRYDVFYKHLKAHLPELRDLGPDFPSPERFGELGFKWLDFLLLGGDPAPMLLVYGMGAKGLHLFWLTAAGFEKAAFFPADTSRHAVVEPDGEKIAVTLSVAGEAQRHEMLWWGP